MTENRDIVQRLADAVPGWGARVAYGEKTSIDGKEMIPVAIATFGFGAGEGSGEGTGDLPADSTTAFNGTGEGSGGGGGGFALPIGAYVSRNGELEFEANPVAVLVAATPVVVGIAAAVACVFATIGSVKAIVGLFPR
jgi:hypothetical protein